MKKNRAQRERFKKMYSLPDNARVKYIKWNTKSKTSQTALQRAENSIMYLKDGKRWRKAKIEGKVPITFKSEFKVVFNVIKSLDKDVYKHL